MATKSRLPTRLPVPPKARLKPTSAHSTEMRPMAKMFCMSMPSTFLDLTMPP